VGYKRTVIFSRLYFCPLSPHHPFARPVVPACSLSLSLSPSLPPPSPPPRSVFFVKFVPAVLTVASARYREPLALFARKASSLLDAGCIFYVVWFPWGSLFDFLLNKQICITRDWKKSVERKRAFVFETLIVEIGDFHYR